MNTLSCVALSPRLPPLESIFIMYNCSYVHTWLYLYAVPMTRGQGAKQSVPSDKTPSRSAQLFKHQLMDTVSVHTCLSGLQVSVPSKSYGQRPLHGMPSWLPDRYLECKCEVAGAKYCAFADGLAG